MPTRRDDSAARLLDQLVDLVADRVADRIVDRLGPEPVAGGSSRLLKLEDVASRLGISERSARDLVNGRDGNPPKMASLRVGPSEGSRVVELSVLEAYIAERRLARLSRSLGSQPPRGPSDAGRKLSVP